jgi:hypothetical protein
LILSIVISLSLSLSLSVVRLDILSVCWLSDYFLLQVPLENLSLVYVPVRIRVRIDPPHPLVCRKRRLNGAVLWKRPGKLRSRVTAGVAQ